MLTKNSILVPYVLTNSKSVLSIAEIFFTKISAPNKFAVKFAIRNLCVIIQ